MALYWTEKGDSVGVDRAGAPHPPYHWLDQQGSERGNNANGVGHIAPGYRERSHCYTDFWRAYVQVIHAAQHSAGGKEQGQTNHVECCSNTLRQRTGRFVRETMSFSKCLHMHLPP